MIQVKIAKLSQDELVNWENTKRKKIDTEIEKIRTRHNNEFNALNLKLNSMFNEFKKRRAVAFDNLVQRFKNKHKELDSSQKQEQNEFKQRMMKNNVSNGHSLSSK